MHEKSILRLNPVCDDKKYKAGICFLLCLVLFMLHSAFHGIYIHDEAFYLTIPYRVYLGDSLIADEWHASQLSSFIQYPPLWSFLKITGSTDGIVLFFRVLYVFCQTAVSVYLFRSFKKYGFSAALMTALLFLISFAPILEAINYFTASIMAIVLVLLLLCVNNKKSAAALLFAGVLLAYAVAAEPSLVLFYLFYTAAVIFFAFKKKKTIKEDTEEWLSVRSWGCITAGAAVIFTVFLFYLFSQASFSEIVSGFSNVFRSGEYSGSTLFTYRLIFNGLKEFRPLFFLYFVWIGAILLFKKKIGTDGKKYASLAGTGILFISLCCVLIDVFVRHTYLGVFYLFYDGMMLTLGFLLLLQKRKKEYFAFFWAGALYILFVGIYSQSLYMIGWLGAMISALPLFPVVFDLAAELELPQKKKTNVFDSPIKKLLKTKSALITSVLSVFGASVFTVFALFSLMTGVVPRDIMDIGDNGASAVCDSGPFKGITITAGQAEIYSDILEDIDHIESRCEGKYTVAGQDETWLMLASDRAPAVFTSWYVQSDVRTFEEYYRQTGITPSAVYLPWVDLHTEGTDGSDYVSAGEDLKYFKEMFDCEVESGKAGYILWVRDRK